MNISSDIVYKIRTTDNETCFYSALSIGNVLLMNFDQSSQKIIGFGDKKLDYYRGLLIRADFNLHAQYAEEIGKRLPKGSKILDFGCGQGSLSMRLKDLGYDVTASDQNIADFKAQGEIPYFPVNFNSPDEVNQFLTKFEGHFDAVLGVEVIEHVENPWEYLRNLKRLVRNDGLIFISTPNVTSWYSRMVFLFTGQFQGFVDPDLIGHINPITPWELQVISSKIGLKTETIRSAGELPLIWVSTSIPKTLLSLMFLPLSIIAKGLILGWCTMAVFRKTDVR